MRCLVVLAYALPAAIVWMLLGLGLTALPLAAVALVGVVGYGGYYGFTELTGSAGLAIPGRRWQVPQTMMINASPPRRVLVWGAILGPGLLTRNPYAGFGLLPIVLAAMSAAVAWGGHSGPSWRTGLAVGAAIGLAHGSARAIALLRDIAELHRPAGGPGFGCRRARRSARFPAQDHLLAQARRIAAARGGCDRRRAVGRPCQRPVLASPPGRINAT